MNDSSSNGSQSASREKSMDRLTATIVQDGHNWILKLVGDVSISSTKPFWIVEILKEVTEGRLESLVIDLSGVEYIDSQGFKFLLDIQKAVTKEGIRVVLQNPAAHLRRLLRIMQFDRIFVIEMTYP